MKVKPENKSVTVTLPLALLQKTELQLKTLEEQSGIPLRLASILQIVIRENLESKLNWIKSLYEKH